MFPVLIFAFLIVACNTVILACFLLFALRLGQNGWTWNDAFLFSTVIASTDAVAVTAVMKGGNGGPKQLIALIEGNFFLIFHFFHLNYLLVS